MNFSKTPIVFIDKDYNRLLDKDQAKIALDKLDNILLNKDNRTTENLIEVLKTIGIRLSDRSIEDILDGKFKVNGKFITANNFFNKNNVASPLSHIHRILNTISKSNNDIEV